MKIAFFTEMGFKGKIPRTHPNMRTEFAWMCNLEADHYNLSDTPEETYDLGIVINSKKNPHLVNVERYKTRCSKVGVMQEGPFWYFQDYDLANQIGYYNNLLDADIIFTHNEQDKKYFKGLTNHKDVRILPTLVIEDATGVLSKEDRSGIMIGGNMVSWYGGFDSFMLAKSVTDEIYQPAMGRKQEGEEQLGIKQLPYLQWDGWIKELNKRKLGVHMMRTHAAGTFALNCSLLGIPCVGYKGLDTQRILHPTLSVEDGDLETARKLVNKLWNNLEFYKENCILTKELYNKKYREINFNII
jgi:hypothetical protein|tara:strand:+ start:7407 stop:8306 length:900 start_codon:yes stop_codon:yes gene_type:complete